MLNVGTVGSSSSSAYNSAYNKSSSVVVVAVEVVVVVGFHYFFLNFKMHTYATGFLFSMGIHSKDIGIYDTSVY